jgi:hypothetical protein
MTPAILAKVESVLKSDVVNAISNIMLPNADGGYHLFGLFDVRETAGRIEVLQNQCKIQDFGSMRVAVSWCIAKKHNKQELATEFVQLDQNLSRLVDSTRTYSEIVNTIKDPQRRIITQTKLEDTRYKLQTVKNRLDKCVSIAKYFQIRGFNDEIERTRRPAPHRTSQSAARKSNRKTH